MRGFIPRKYLYWIYRPIWRCQQFCFDSLRVGRRVEWLNKFWMWLSDVPFQAIDSLADRINSDCYRFPLSTKERERLFGSRK